MVSILKHPLRDPTTHHEGWFGLLFNLVLAQSESRCRLEHIERHMLDNLAHEMRTPLTIIQGLAELIADDLQSAGMLNPDRLRDLDEIQRACQGLHRITERGISYVRLQLGTLTRRLEEIRIGEILQEVVCQLSAEADDRRLAVAVEIPTSTRDELVADGLCLEMAIRALHENAIKFNLPGGHIRWEIASCDDRVEISVTNSGVPVAPEQTETMFQAFMQGDPTLTRRFGGLGLGLPLVQEVVSLHHGTLTAGIESGGGGMQFRISLPRSGMVS
jgi:signal transduction histidine kinase